MSLFQRPYALMTDLHPLLAVPDRAFCADIAPGGTQR
jgi:hypothetical protein